MCTLAGASRLESREHHFMTTYFIGGAFGTFLAGTAWHHAGWGGVALTGTCLAGFSLLITLFAKH